VTTSIKRFDCGCWFVYDGMTKQIHDLRMCTNHIAAAVDKRDKEQKVLQEMADKKNAKQDIPS